MAMPRTRFVRRSAIFARRRASPWRPILLLLGIGFLALVWQTLPRVARDLEAAAPASQSATRSAGAEFPPVITARVASVVDGDGLILRSGEEIRLGDFNAPEWNQEGGPEAKDALRAIAYGETVDCTPCEGARRAGQCRSYDRIIATCRLNGQRLGDLMRARGIREGGR